MSLKIFNVLGREKQEFVPIHPNKVNMYVCGLTVQDYAHIGHAKTYISFDMVVRYLRWSGYDVLYVQNLTDVGHLLDSGEDRVLKKAREASVRPMQIVETYTRSYFEDMDALGVQRPDISPRASAHIPEQIEMIQTLLDKEQAYIADDGVYFDVTSWPEYGKLSNRKLEEQESGRRQLKGSGKRNNEDFVLWVLSTPDHILQWNSPWGRGYPGWHIECSAMSRKYLGPNFDIHGGGIDNIFPHNECEIAQSEAANDTPFANYWMLVGSLTLEGRKMSKSLGNIINIKQALKQYRPEAIRMFVFQAHYSNPVDYREESLYAATSGVDRLLGTIRLNREKMNTAPDNNDGVAFIDTIGDYKQQFVTAMDDDFNAPVGVAALQNFTTEVNKLLNSRDSVGQPVLGAINELYMELAGKVLGLLPSETSANTAVNAERVGGLVNLLIDLRQQARAERQFARADQIRDQLKELGITLEDRPEGTVFRAD